MTTYEEKLQDFADLAAEAAKMKQSGTSTADMHKWWREQGRDYREHHQTGEYDPNNMPADQKDKPLTFDDKIRLPGAKFLSNPKTGEVKLFSGEEIKSLDKGWRTATEDERVFAGIQSMGDGSFTKKESGTYDRMVVDYTQTELNRKGPYDPYYFLMVRRWDQAVQENRRRVEAEFETARKTKNYRDTVL